MVGQRRGEVIRTPLEQAWGRDDRSTDELVALMERLAR